MAPITPDIIEVFLLFKMPRTRKRTTEKAGWTAESLKAAADLVQQRPSIIDFITLLKKRAFICVVSILSF